MSSEPLFASCPLPLTDTSEVQLAHGSGGKLTGQLIEDLLLPAFRNPILEALPDAANVPISGGRIAFTTDSYVVTPIFFPGGNIGELAVNGTINDLAVAGARPRYLSVSFILEEGFPLGDLRRIVESMRDAAAGAGVMVVTGDTKVVNRGKADGVFINTAGIGELIDGVHLSSSNVCSGDTILVSGTLGDHGVAILAARERLELGDEIRSDTAALHGMVEAVLAACPEVHAMRDPTRGGLAATLVEFASRERVGIEIDEAKLPVQDPVRGACELLGLDPMLIANEGKLVVFVPAAAAPRALAAMRMHPLGRNACAIGHVTDAHPGRVIARTAVGGERIVDLPFGELLPRIC